MTRAPWEPIVKRFILYIIICFLSITALLALHIILERQVDRFSRQEANEQAKNTLSLFIQKRVLMVQNQFQYMMLASSRGELELANQDVRENLAAIEKALRVLDEGGTYTESFFVNFGNRENIDQALDYAAPEKETVSLSAIEMKTNLARLEELSREYYRIMGQRMAGNTARNQTPDDLTLYHKKIAPFFQRIIENSNRLYFESLDALRRASQTRERQVSIYEQAGAGVSLMAIGVILAFGVFIIRDIVVILDERRRARQALVAANENLEAMVAERTTSLQAEVAERRRAQENAADQARFLTTVIESLNHPFYVIDADTYEIAIANQAARQMNEEQKHRCYELTHNRDTPCQGKDHPCPIEQIKETGQPVVMEHLHFDKGRPVNVEVYGYPILNPEGKVHQVIEYTLDVTEKKKAQQALKRSRDELEELVVKRTRSLQKEIENRVRLQRGLEKREHHFKKLIGNINDIIFIVGEKGEIKFVSSSVQRVLGYAPEEILGRALFDFIHPEELPGDQDVLENFLSFTQRESQAETRVLNKAGEYRIMESSLRFMLNDPDINGIIFTSRDVTQRKKDEQTQKKLRLAVEQNPNTVVITDTLGTIEYVNPAFEQVTGYSREEAVGQNPRILSSGKVPASVFEEMWATLTQGRTWKGQFINRKKSGELYNENAVVTPLTDDTGKTTHYVAIKENITELVAAREQAEAATKAKSEFLANMSHEIRTPMNAIIGMTKLALITELTPRQQGYLKKIDISATTLLDLINSLLDFSKIEANRLELEQTEFDICQLLTETNDILSVRGAEKREVEILYDISSRIPSRILGDPLRLKQILLNLGENALKFTRTGHVIIQMTPAAPGDGSPGIEIAVQDTGIGMSEDQVGKLFRAFSQADASTTRQYGGTGLGLAICSRLVSLMGGRLKVESHPGRGSRFYFSIHLPRARGAIPLKERWGSTAGNRTLFVLGTARAGQLYTGLLTSLGGQAVAVATGQEALAALDRAVEQGRPFQSLVLDRSLPDMDGIAVCRQLGQPASPLRCVLLARLDETDLAPGDTGLIQAVLTKPVLPLSLVAALTGRGPGVIPGQASGSSDPSPESLAAIRGARILVVEDNVINQDVAKAFLETAGFSVTLAADGQQGVDSVRNHPFDLVFMDIQMPVMDGHQATREIRKTHPELPVVAMSATSFPRDRETALASGMNAFMGKPFTPQEILGALVTWIPGKNQPASRSAHQGPFGGAGPADAPPLELEGINTVQGLARAGGNRALYRKILGRFRQTHQDTAHRIRSLLEENPSGQIRHLLHSLKGEAGSIGAEALFTSVRNLERCLDRDPGSAPSLLAEVDAHMNRLLTSLDQVAPQALPAATDEAPDWPERLPDPGVFRDLLPLLRQGSLSGSRNVLERALATEWPGEILARIRDLESLVDRYRFKAALEQAERIIASLTQRDKQP